MESEDDGGIFEGRGPMACLARVLTKTGEPLTTLQDQIVMSVTRMTSSQKIGDSDRQEVNQRVGELFSRDSHGNHLEVLMAKVKKRWEDSEVDEKIGRVEVTPALVCMRGNIRQRVQDYVAKNPVKQLSLVNIRNRKGEELSQRTIGESADRPRRSTRRTETQLEYGLEPAKEQPNWKQEFEEPEDHLCNKDFERMRKNGYGRVKVKKSLVPGDSGWGLYADKKIKKGTIICGYDGIIVTEEALAREGINRDYMAEAIKDQRTGERIYVDAIQELSGYGRFAQDPIDEELVNAKIVWRKGAMVIIAMDDICPGEEIYVHYGLDYWKDRLDLLDQKLRDLIEPRVGRKGVQFRGECQVKTFQMEEAPN